MSHEDSDPDAMRAVHSLVEPDRRMRFLSIRDRHGSRALSQSDRHALVSQYVLVDAVPLDIRVHFETARNLFVRLVRVPLRCRCRAAGSAGTRDGAQTQTNPPPRLERRRQARSSPPTQGIDETQRSKASANDVVSNAGTRGGHAPCQQ